MSGRVPTLQPYLYVPPALLDFVQAVFGAEILARHDTPGGWHVQARIGASPFVLEVGERFPDHVDITRSTLYVHIDDVDAVYARALEAGAESVMAPADQPYGERSCGIRDPAGNVWWIATPDDWRGS